MLKEFEKFVGKNGIKSPWKTKIEKKGLFLVKVKCRSPYYTFPMNDTAIKSQFGLEIAKTSPKSFFRYLILGRSKRWHIRVEGVKKSENGDEREKKTERGIYFLPG